MTVGNAIAEVDALWPNAYSDEQKARWLSRCESTIYQEIIRFFQDVTFTGFHEGDNLNYRLIAPEPYDQLYIYWLEAMVHYSDGEISKYNNAMQMFNSMLAAYRKWYGQTHDRLYIGRFLF